VRGVVDHPSPYDIGRGLGVPEAPAEEQDTERAEEMTAQRGEDTHRPKAEGEGTEVLGN
jgi:hypothetical protein